MAIFNDRPAAQSPDSSLRLPAQRRISAPSSQRLTTITEGANAGANTQWPKSILRNTASPRPGDSRHNSGGVSLKSQETTRTGPPPPYERVPKSIRSGEDGHDLAGGEKVAQPRRTAQNRHNRRGGWGRLALILGVVLFLVIALGVGLGVGLSKKRKAHNSTQASPSTQPAGTTPSTGQAQSFPLGEYSLITALRTTSTNCTSNPSTWRCYPYTTFSASDSSTNTSSLATFNWIVSNTSSTYATTNTTSLTTSGEGIPANLTISSTQNPFSISFSDAPLTYISASASNASSARYTFAFTMSKVVIPSSDISGDNAAAECFFNQTLFSATLYLDVPSTFPSEELAGMSGVGGYTPWPFAVEVIQSSAGGKDVPACYETVNGAVGDRIVNGLEAEAVGNECLCDYRNYQDL